ncbi:MAG: hypothetical protein ACRENB_14330 [Gemmatimonadales bacterium]
MIALPKPQLVLALGAMAAIVTGGKAAAQARQRPLPQVAYQRLDSLERAALTGLTFADRLHAVSTITSIAVGQGECMGSATPTTIRYPGLVSRLATIYRRSQGVDLREAILDKMLWHSECAEAVAFLAGVAEEAPVERAPASAAVYDEVRPSLQLRAISVLVSLGTHGEPALRRLHAQGSVRDSSARASLETLSRHGFRRPEKR